MQRKERESDFPEKGRQADTAHAPLYKAAGATAPLPTEGTKSWIARYPGGLPVRGAVFPDHLLI